MKNILCQKANSGTIEININRLAEYNSTPGYGITRIALSSEDMEGRAFIKNAMKSIGLEVSEDGAANIYGTYPGSDRNLAPVWTGSHLDTVPNGGRFDGISGVVCGIEAVRLIKESGFVPKRDISVICYTSEEPSRYGVGCIGSRVLAGKMTESEAKTLIDTDKITLWQKLQNLGFDLNNIADMKKKKGDVYASVELHVEQGSILERTGNTIGIVHTISAPTEIHVTAHGIQSHAGATPMEYRKDTVAAVAEAITGLERLACQYENPSTVATVGKINVYPNSSNVISGHTDFSVDIRSDKFSEKEKILSDYIALLSELEIKRDVKFTTEIICNDKPAVADKNIQSIIRDACEEHNCSYIDMASGAYHDSLMISEFAPFGMIFLPSIGGISHDKNEKTDFEDLAKGTDILAETLLELAME